MTIEEVRLALRDHIMDLLDETAFGGVDSFIEPDNGDFILVWVGERKFYFRLALMPTVQPSPERGF